MESAPMPRVSAIASTRVLSLPPEASIAQAVTLLAERRVSCLVIVDGDRPVGIVTERDLLRLSCSGFDETQPVRGIMSTPPITVPHNLDFAEAQAMLANRGVRHLVLVDPSGALYGVVTETDFRRHLGHELYGAIEHLGNVMDASGLLIDPDTPLSLALETMASRRLDHLVMGRDGRALGILTERDVPRLLAAHVRTALVPVSQVMARGLKTIPVDAPVTLAAERLAQTGLRHLVVVDEAGRFAGTLSQHRMLERLSALLLEERHRLLAEQAQGSERDFRAFVENLQIPLCNAGADGTLRYINRRFTEVFGYTLEDIPNLDTWWPWAYPDLDYRSWVRETWDQAVAQAQECGTPIRSVEYRVTCKDGAVRYVEIGGVLMGDDLLATFVDLTDRHRMRERAEELLGRLQKIAAKIPGVVYQYQQWQDGRTAFPYASPGIRDIYGVTPEQVAEDATPVLKALHPDDLARVAASIRDSMETLTTWHDTYRVVLPDGRTRWLEGESEPEAVPDGSVLWHGYIRDITRAREDAERQAAQLGELRRWQAVMLDREDRALPLKAEVNALLARLGEAPRYLVGLGGDALP